MHPYLLHIGHVLLPTFGVLAAVGLMLALGLSQYTAAATHLDPDRLWDAGLFAILAAFVSSRALLVATHLHNFVAHPVLLLAVPSLTATGLLVTAIATYLWLRWKRLPTLPMLDAWAPCGTLLWAFLALGHFAEGSDPGMPTALPLGMRMRGDSTPLHPVALYAFCVALVLTALLFRALKSLPPRGSIAGLALASTGAAQYGLSFVRQPGTLSIGGLDALQLVALAMLVAGGILFAVSVRRAHTPAMPREVK